MRTLKNIGPVSWGWLEAAGMPNVDAVRKAGAVGAYVAVCMSGQRASRNLLYALATGLEDRDIFSLSDEEKGRLIREAEDLLDNFS